MFGINLNPVVFAAYLIVVAAVGILASRKNKEEETDDYFLAGRNLTWWVIGGSLIAADISTHHFIGMSGQAFTIGTVLIVGGLVVTVAGLIKVGGTSPGYGGTVWGGFKAIIDSSPEKFNMVQPWNIRTCLGSACSSAIPARAILDRTFTADVAAAMKKVAWYLSFRFWASGLIAIVVLLYVRFF